MQNDKVVVNEYWLDEFLAPLYLEGDDNHPLFGINLNNEESMVKLVGEVLEPTYHSYAPHQQLRLKEALRYALNAYSDRKLSGAYDHALPALEMPSYKTPKEFFQDIWRLMLGDENYIVDIEDYVVIDDPSESIFAKGVERRALEKT